MKKFFLIFLVFFLKNFIFSQDFEKKFIEHLINKENYDDAIYCLNNLDLKEFKNHDSIFYLKGYCFYKKKDIQLSIKNFSKITESSTFYEKSRFFISYENLYLYKYDLSLLILKDLNIKNENLEKLRNLQFAGISLLKRDIENFKIYEKKFKNNYFVTADAEKNFVKYFKEINNYKNKSPFFAGFLSTFLPGSGKIYAGKLGEGISSFFMCFTFGVLFAENFVKQGKYNPQTILFGSAFSVFYLGGIYGSYKAAEHQNHFFYENIQNKILFNLHIPIRTFFN